ncbi:metal-dependent hydrolase [Halobellus salinisoli]|uniref:metal-dependent hydrolase n=1 Tax=Halobellus salinisoli TaxID=3108500 RepID=UPI00300AFA83
MWPWEHLVFGYVLYSTLNALVWEQPIEDGTGLALAVATQLPDLVDKPLSWTFGLVATGYGPAHSLFVAGPIALGVVAVLWTRGKTRVAVAVLVGYGSHLFADVLALRANGPNVARALWPLVSQPPYESDLGFFERFTEYFGTFLLQMMHTENVGLVLGYVSIFVIVAVRWVMDGMPGIRWARRKVKYVT